MKTFRLFSIAALALVMAACSNDDNEILQQPEQQQGKMHFTATIAAPNSGASTRTTVTPGTGEDEGKYFVTWNTTDKIALVYEDKEGYRQLVQASVDAVDGSGNATISATLPTSVTDGTAVTLVYPYDIVTSADADPFFGLNYTASDIRYFNQNVTSIEDALPTLDWREGSSTFSVGVGGVSLSSNVTMAPQVAIWKLNLTVGGNAFTAATSLVSLVGEATVSDGSVNLFVPLPFFNAYQALIPIEFSATEDYMTHYVYVPTGTVTLTGGKIYTSTLALQELLYSELTVTGCNQGIYYTNGESWQIAITAHKNNSGDWQIEDGKVKSLMNFGKYLKNADGSTFIDPDSDVDPSVTYSWSD